MDSTPGSQNHPKWNKTDQPSKGQSGLLTDGESISESESGASNITASSSGSYSHLSSDSRHSTLRPRSLINYRISRAITEQEKEVTAYPVQAIAPSRFAVAGPILNGNSIIEYHSLKQCAEQLDITSRVTTKDSENPAAGKGCFALQGYRPCELVGLYKGELVRRKNLPDQWASSYKKHFKLSDKEVVYPVFAVWSGEGRNAHFIKAPDTYTAWSGVKVYRQGEELGIDGSDYSSPLSYLNHSDIPNVVILSVIHPDYLQRITPDGTQYITPQGVLPDNLLLAVVCTQSIKEGEELTFRYGNNPNFEKVGLDVHKAPQHCMRSDNGRLKFLPPHQWQDDAFSMLSTSPDSQPLMNPSDNSNNLSESDSDDSPILPRRKTVRKDPLDSSSEEESMECESLITPV